MFGHERPHEPIKGKFLKELLDQMERIRTGNLNQDDLERIAFQNRTPEYEIIWEGETAKGEPNISNICAVCDYYRDEKICPGQKYSCDKFKNRFDNDPIEQAKPRKERPKDEIIIP